MARFPTLVGEVVIKDWEISFKNLPKCYLYDFDSMGITTKDFVSVIAGKKAAVFEKEFKEFVGIHRCPWCEYDSKKDAAPALRRNLRLKKDSHRSNIAHRFNGVKIEDHVAEHCKNIVSIQVKKFQEELYSMRLELVRKGYHGALSFFVEHECQACIDPIISGRKGMCAIPEGPRNRVRCLKTLGYPIKHITKLRTMEWSCLGVIVLLKN